MEANLIHYERHFQTSNLIKQNQPRIVPRVTDFVRTIPMLMGGIPLYVCGQMVAVIGVALTQVN